MNRREFAGAAAMGLASLLVTPREIIGESRGLTLRAGAAEIDATPETEGLFLIGPESFSTGVNDPLFARALVLSDGRTQLVIVTLDYLGFDMEYTDVLLDAAARASGSPRDHIMLNCSHTHGAPLTARWGPWRSVSDASLERMLPLRVTEVVTRARERLQPARLRVRREPMQIGFNRRLLSKDRIVMAPNPQGAVVPWLDVLAVETSEGMPIVTLFSHAAHPVIVHGTSTLVTGDYPGFAVRAARDGAGEGLMMFGQGCGGNINGFPLRGGIEAAKAAGAQLGDGVLRALGEATEILPATPLRAYSTELALPLQTPPAAGMIREMITAERRPDRKERLLDLLAISESGRRETIRMPIRAFSLGPEICILGLAHEPFAEYFHFAESVSPFAHTMVLGYTNGLATYVATKADYLLGERGGYEASPWGAAFMFDTRLPLIAGAEAQIREGIRHVLGAVTGRRGTR